MLGGNLGSEIKAAGYDAIVVRGHAEKPVYFYIEDERVEIRDAGPLWGKGVFEAEEEIRKDLGKKRIRLISIGPAGENRVKFACMASNMRQAGRGGAGAVMGSKNLKSLVLLSHNKVKVHQEDTFRKMIRQITKEDVLTDENLWYRINGTPGVSLRKGELLPTRNFQYGVFENATNLDANAVNSKMKRRKACKDVP